jgi:Ca2+-binding EF-hand superfamily protein
MENKTSYQDYQVPAQYFGAFPTEVRTNLAKAFHHYDKNGDKTMDEQEFKSVLHDMGFRDIGDEQVKEMLKEQDQNNDGVISWLEFLEMMKKVAGKDPAYFT